MSWKKIIAVIMGALTIGATGVYIGANEFPVVNNVPVYNTAQIQNAFNSGYASGVESVDTDKYFNDGVESVEVATEYVENENLPNVINFLEETEGNIPYIFEDYDEDEDSVLDRMTTMIDNFNMGKDAVESEIADELDGYEFVFADNSTVEFDEDDIEQIKVDGDIEDVEVISVDFEDGDYELEYSFTFEHDDIDFKGTAIVGIEDSEYDDLEITSIDLD